MEIQFVGALLATLDNVSTWGVEIAMPYIHETERKALDRGTIEISTPGQLNYSFTMLALEYLELVGTNYQHINDVLGALEGAKQEFYRRVAIPYENAKIKQNGDVYGE